MKKLLVFVVAVFFGLSISALAFAEEKAPAKEKPLYVKKENLVTATATVEAIDLQKRVVTLKGPKGNVFDVTVGEAARNLPQLKVGDLVKVKYYESIAFRIVKPGEGVAGVEEMETLERAKKGEKPGGLTARLVTITATITAIDKKEHMVTLRGPQGKSVTVKAENPKNLAKVKVGDEVEITYSKALAISVEEAKKK
jgi:NMD protein affecting ribosome stability and mRNA decay